MQRNDPWYFEHRATYRSLGPVTQAVTTRQPHNSSSVVAAPVAQTSVTRPPQQSNISTASPASHGAAATMPATVTHAAGPHYQQHNWYQNNVSVQPANSNTGHQYRSSWPVTQPWSAQSAPWQPQNIAPPTQNPASPRQEPPPQYLRTQPEDRTASQHNGSGVENPFNLSVPVSRGSDGQSSTNKERTNRSNNGPPSRSPVTSSRVPAETSANSVLSAHSGAGAAAEQAAMDGSWLQGTVQRITYTSLDTGYTVLKVKPSSMGERPPGSSKGRQSLITVVGTFPDASVGQVLVLCCLPNSPCTVDGAHAYYKLINTFQQLSLRCVRDNFEQVPLTWSFRKVAAARLVVCC